MSIRLLTCLWSAATVGVRSVTGRSVNSAVVAAADGAVGALAGVAIAVADVAVIGVPRAAVAVRRIRHA